MGNLDKTSQSVSSPDAPWPFRLFFLLRIRLETKKILKRAMKLILESDEAGKDIFYPELRKRLTSRIDMSIDVEKINENINILRGEASEGDLQSLQADDEVNKICDFTKKLLKNYLNVLNAEKFEDLKKELKELYNLLYNNINNDRKFMDSLVKKVNASLEVITDKQARGIWDEIAQKYYIKIYERVTKDKENRLKKFYTGGGLDKKEMLDAEYWRDRINRLYSEDFYNKGLLSFGSIVEGLVKLYFSLKRELGKGEKDNFYAIVNDLKGSRPGKLAKRVGNYYYTKINYSNLIGSSDVESLQTTIENLIDVINIFVNNFNLENIPKDELVPFDNSPKYKDKLKDIKNLDYDVKKLKNELKQLSKTLKEFDFGEEVNTSNIKKLLLLPSIAESISFLLFENKDKASILNTITNLSIDYNFCGTILKNWRNVDEFKQKNDETIDEFINTVLNLRKKVTPPLDPRTLLPVINFKGEDLLDANNVLIKTYLNVSVAKFKALDPSELDKLKGLAEFYEECLDNIKKVKDSKGKDFGDCPIVVAESRRKIQKTFKVSEEEMKKINEQMKNVKEKIDDLQRIRGFLFKDFENESLDKGLVFHNENSVLSNYRNDLIFFYAFRDNLINLSKNELKNKVSSINNFRDVVNKINWSIISKNYKSRIEELKSFEYIKEEFKDYFDKEIKSVDDFTGKKKSENIATKFGEFLGFLHDFLTFIKELSNLFEQINSLFVNKNGAFHLILNSLKETYSKEEQKQG